MRSRFSRTFREPHGTDRADGFWLDSCSEWRGSVRADGSETVTSERAVPEKPITIAILGGGQEELNILSEFHRTPGVRVVAIYDRDPRAIGLEIAEIIKVPTYCDETFLPAFSQADYIVVSENRQRYESEIALLKREHKRLINPAEAMSHFTVPAVEEEGTERRSWPAHLEEVLQYMSRISDRNRLLKWLLEISVRAVDASSGSIMLYSAETRELYIGYATGLSAAVVERTRQKLGDGIAGTVARIQKPLRIAERVPSPVYQEGREREHIQSAIAAPLVHEGKLLGVLNVSTNLNEKVLDDSDVETITLLSSKIAPILGQHLLIDAHEIREIEFQIRNYIETLFHNGLEFHEKFTLLCRFLAERLQADTVAIYTATDEGDWLILGGSDQQVPVGAQSPRIHCHKGSLSRAYLNGDEVLMTEASHEAGLKLKNREGSATSIYLPLAYGEPLGVLVVEFSGLAAFQRFSRFKDALRFQVAFFAYSQIRDIRQSRQLESLEALSSLVPKLLTQEDLSATLKRLPVLLSSLVKASMGSLHFEASNRSETIYHHFPEEEAEGAKRIEYDAEIFRMVMSKWEPVCLSYLTTEVSLFEKPPLHRSVVGFPLFSSENTRIVYIGYDKMPTTPLDSSIFGAHEVGLLRRLDDFLGAALTKREVKIQEPEPVTFEDLLHYNQKLMIERIREEIERAERYHHSFMVTIFKINGLQEMLNRDYKAALRLINELSMGIRKQVRKTDFFSWTEADLFAILSIEGYQRMGFLEKRISTYLIEELKEKGLYNLQSFYPVSGYAVFPGSSSSAAELIQEAKSKIQA
jgi:GAF domain-containing protein/GGDEF domain-containing protein